MLALFLSISVYQSTRPKSNKVFHLKTVKMLVYVSAFFILTTFVHFRTALVTRPLVLVVSLDGFRYDYATEELTPNIMKIRRQGVYSEYMNNVVPTLTLVNHWTMATGSNAFLFLIVNYIFSHRKFNIFAPMSLGRYAGEHGVVANKLFDLKLKRSLGYGEELFTQNEDIIPIFTMNQLNGLHSGSMMWPGGEFAYTVGKVNATFAQPLADIPWEKRIDTVISWFKHKDTPANFVMMYLDEPDSQEHAFSPESNEVGFGYCHSAICL